MVFKTSHCCRKNIKAFVTEKVRQRLSAEGKKVLVLNIVVVVFSRLLLWKQKQCPKNLAAKWAWTEWDFCKIVKNELCLS